MNILFDHQAFTRQAAGGVSRSFVELARAINQSGNNQARIFAPLHWNLYLEQPGNRPFCTGLHQSRGIFRFWNQRWHLNHAITLLRCQVQPPDILHETWYSSMPYRIPKKIKIATTVHDLIYQIHPEWTDDAKIRSRELSDSLQRADVVFCVSEHTRMDLLNWVKLDPAKVFTIHHGVTTLAISSDFKSPVSDFRPQAAGLQRPYVLYVGQRSSKNKNFALLAEAYAKSGLQAGFQMLCFGGGPFNPAETAMFRKLGCKDEDAIQLSGDDSRLAMAYQHAAVLVYPSLYEGFGLPLLEAMSLGCPVLCSKASCHPEICGPAALYFDADSTEDLAVNMKLLLHDSHLREVLVKKGFDQSKLYTWEKSAHQALNAYRSILH